MDISLISSFKFHGNSNTKHFFCQPISFTTNNKRRPVRVSMISCRATNLGIGNNETNFYDVLCISPNNASTYEVKKVYRTMALRYHPDVCHPSMKAESTQMFLRLNAAYRTLSDPVLREEYDYELGLSKCGNGKLSRMSRSISNEEMRRQWRDQVDELKRRSSIRMAQKDGSWGSRKRAENMH